MLAIVLNKILWKPINKTRSKHKQHKLNKEMLKVSPPQNDRPLQELLLLHISLFLTGMAKGLGLCSEAIKLR